MKPEAMTPAEIQIAIRIERCADSLRAAFGAETNPRVLSCAILLLIEERPEMSVAFEALCQHWAVTHVMTEARLTKEKRLEMARKARGD